MDLNKLLISPNRFQFSEALTEEEVDYIISNSQISTIQATVRSVAAIDTSAWKKINTRLLVKRPDIQVRVFGSYPEKCDLSFLQHLTNVTNLSIDRIDQAENVEEVVRLKKLKKLSIGIFSLESFEFLEQTSPSLEKLFLGVTKSKKPDLSVMRRFTKLTEAYIEGQNRGIETLGALSSLEKLTLRSVTSKDIRFIRKLKNLWSLDIKLGGINDLSLLKGLDNLKYLELWKIRELSDISVISSLKGLQFFFLQDLKNVIAMPDVSELVHLRRICLLNMKGLKDISPLENSLTLKEFVHTNSQNMDPKEYLNLLKLKTLKKALIGFKNKKKKQEIEKLMLTNNVAQYSHEEFVFK